MKIAVTFLAGQVLGTFDKTKAFAVFDIENNKVTAYRLLHVEVEHRQSLVALLNQNAIDILICGRIGERARAQLRNAKIEFVAGVQGNVRNAVEEYLAGTLKNDPVKYNVDY